MIEAPTGNIGYSKVAGHREEDTPVGYKRTEVGLVPEDWSISTVGAEFRVQLGKMLDAAKNQGVSKPYVGNRSIQWGHVNVDAIETVSLTPVELNRFLLRRGDLLVCEGGEIGRAAIWNDPIPECYYQKALHRLRPIRGYNSLLMMFLLRLWATTGFLTNFATRTSIAHLPKENFETIPLPVPLDHEQRAIVEALSDVDKSLESPDALIAKKRAIKKATMHQLLTGETRLPGYGGEWRTIRLGDLGQWRGGMTPLTSVPHYWIGGTVPWLTSSDVRQGQLNDSSENITKQAVKETGIPVIRSNSTIVVVRSGILRRFLPVANNSIPVAINQDLRALEPDPLHSPQYLVHALMGVEKYLLRDCLKAGTTVESIDSTWFQGFKLSMPTLDEQDAIAAVLSDMDTEISALKTRLKKICAIKDGMMQQLLTGRVRLVEQVRQPDNEQVAP